MGDGKKPNRKALFFGPIPVDLINRTLGTELEPGDARMPKHIHEKIGDKHADDYELVMKYASITISDPGYIGEHPNHAEKIELIRRTDQGSLLVAIAITRTPQGNYNIASAYAVQESDIARWRASGILKLPKRQSPA